MQKKRGQGKFSERRRGAWSGRKDHADYVDSQPNRLASADKRYHLNFSLREQIKFKERGK